MQKYLLMAMMAAGTPIALQAQGNGVTIVVNDGSQTANSISGIVYSEEDNEPLIGVQVRIVCGLRPTSRPSKRGMETSLGEADV